VQGIPAYCSRSASTFRARARGPSWMAPAVDLDAGALLEVGIEDRLAGRAPARLGTLENQFFSANPPDEVLYGHVRAGAVL
jgi:hypothetical protein